MLKHTLLANDHGVNAHGLLPEEIDLVVSENTANANLGQAVTCFDDLLSRSC